VRTWRRRQELLDMFALDDASLRAFGVTRAEIVIALEDGRRVVLSPKLASTLEARRHDAVQACEANGSAR
jgi:hypothetical protein